MAHSKPENSRLTRPKFFAELQVFVRISRSTARNWLLKGNESKAAADVSPAGIPDMNSPKRPPNPNPTTVFLVVERMQDSEMRSTFLGLESQVEIRSESDAVSDMPFVPMGLRVQRRLL